MLKLFKAKLRLTTSFLFLSLLPFAASAADPVVEAINKASADIQKKIGDTEANLLNFYTGAQYNLNAQYALEKTSPSPSENTSTPESRKALDYGKNIKQINSFAKQERTVENLSRSILDYAMFGKNFPGSEDPTIYSKNYILDNFLKGYCDPELVNKEGGGALKKDKLCQPGDPAKINHNLDIGQALMDKDVLKADEQAVAARALANQMPLALDFAEALRNDPNLRETESREKIAKHLQTIAAFSANKALYTFLYDLRKAYPVQGSDGSTLETSKLNELKKAVENTFGNEDWYKKVDEAPSEVSLMKGVLQQMALNNALLLQMIQLQERAAAVNAAAVINSFNTSQKFEKIISGSGLGGGQFQQ